MTDTPFASGGCLCGAVSWRAANPPARMAQCHCRDCQRASGTGHMSLAFFKEEDVAIEGEVTGYDATADSGNINTRYFCPRCGSRLFTRNSGRPGVVGVAVGSSADSGWFAPGAVVYEQSRPAWDITTTDIPHFETMPPPPR